MLDSLFWAAIVTFLASPLLLFLRDKRGAEDAPDPALPLSEAPCVHEVPPDVAEFVIPDFRPGIDRCHVALRDADAEFDAVLDRDGIRFQFLDGGSFLEVVFPGLIDPPFEDTCIFGPGAATHGRRLSELVGHGPSPPDPDRFHRVRSEIAAFQTFSAAREVVEVWVPPDAETLPEIDVRPSSDGVDAEVMIDGRPAARLCGAPEAGRGNVRVVRQRPGDIGARGTSGGSVAQPDQRVGVTS